MAIICGMVANESVIQAENYVEKEVERLIPNFGEIVVLAIGSDRVTGDCLGPLVGHTLAMRGVTVYGGLRSPVNALNIGEVTEIIKKRHPSAFIIAVDSAVGADEEIGKVRVIPRGLRPAAATGCPLPRVGNISVVGIVSPKRLGAKALGEVRLGSVFSIACIIAEGIYGALMKRQIVWNDSAECGVQREKCNI